MEKDIDVKTVFSELIKMLMDHDQRMFPEGFQEAQDLHKIQGFQDLTNRLQYTLTQELQVNVKAMGARVEVHGNKIEGLDKRESCE